MDRDERQTAVQAARQRVAPDASLGRAQEADFCGQLFNLGKNVTLLDDVLGGLLIGLVVALCIMSVML